MFAANTTASFKAAPVDPGGNSASYEDLNDSIFSGKVKSDPAIRTVKYVSFQYQTNANRNTTTTDGMANGKAIDLNILNSLAPSISADSAKTVGIVLKN